MGGYCELVSHTSSDGGDGVLVFMRGAVAEPILHGFEVKKGRRIARSSPAQRTKTLLSVLDVDALFAHGGQLAPFGHEHDQEHQSRGDN